MPRVLRAESAEVGVWMSNAISMQIQQGREVKHEISIWVLPSEKPRAERSAGQVEKT